MNMLAEKIESEFVRHIPCEACGSTDANSMYTDGHTFCFSCDAHTHGDSTTDQPMGVVSTKSSSGQAFFLQGEYLALPARRLTAETCRKFGYSVADYRGSKVQVANYRGTDGTLVAQKVRTKNKEFSVVGDGKKMGLFGAHLWSKGRKIVICEGEIDTMSVSQVQGNKWATVGVPHGAQSAKKHLLANWDYLSNFQEIILMLDSDPAGQAAALECAEALPVGRAWIASLPRKDPNECLANGEGAEIINAIFQAREFRPDGIIEAKDLRDLVSVPDVNSKVTYPYSRLNELTHGIRTSAIVTLAAGSGVGKSTLIREIAYHLHKQGHICGLIMLEETTKRTLQGIVGLHINKNIVVDPESATKEEIEAGFDDLFQDRQMLLYDHFGSGEPEVIFNRIRYMAAMGAKYQFLDHISIMTSSATSAITDERRFVDSLMTSFRQLAQELDICLFIVSHLKRPNSEAGHEGGAKVQLSQLRSSHSIAQLSDQCIGLEIDPDDTSGGLRNLVLLKNRHSGEVGQAGSLQYFRDTGRLIDADGFVPF
jgi:twinkle protein